jgi:hypothetical protein
VKQAGWNRDKKYYRPWQSLDCRGFFAYLCRFTSPLKHGFGFFSNNSWDIKTNYAEESEKEEEN